MRTKPARDKTAKDLWTFSLAVYDQPGVAAACLGLQDRHGLDVNILLYCCWAGVRGQTLDSGQFRQLRDASRAWSEEIVQPLRALRRRLKTEPGDAEQDLRARILDLELEAERLEQARLLAALPLPADTPEPKTAGANLRGYIKSRKLKTDETDMADLATILGASFPDLPPLLSVWFVVP